MARPKALKPKPSPSKSEDVEYSTREAQSRFERAVDIAVATKPMHKPSIKRPRKKRA